MSTNNLENNNLENDKNNNNNDPKFANCNEYDIYYFVAFFTDKLASQQQKDGLLSHIKNCPACQDFAAEVQYSISGMKNLTRQQQLIFAQFLVSPLWNKLEKSFLVDKVKEQIHEDLQAIDFMLNRIIQDTSKRFSS